MGSSEAPILKLYPRLDVTQPKITKRSRLYDLTPIGVGTAEVEGLNSYTSRLAQAHNVKNYHLVKYEIIPLLGSSSFLNRETVYWTHLMLNGISELSKKWVDALEQLTSRPNLRFLTMLPWGDVVTKPITRSTRAWCPKCFSEWESHGCILYEPLIWSLVAVSICTKHNLLLQDRCPHPQCQKRQLPLSTLMFPGFCSYCRQWLGIYPNTEESESASSESGLPQQQVWTSEKIGELIASTPNLARLPTTQDLTLALRTLVANAGNGKITDFSKMTSFSVTAIHHWLQNLNPIQFSKLLELCFFFKISPLNLLTGSPLNFETAEEATYAIGAEKTQVQLKPKVLYDAQLYDDLEKLLTSDPPLSLNGAANLFQASIRALQSYYPELCRAISLRYATYITKKKNDRISKIVSEIRQSVFAIYAEGQFPSRARVSKRISKSWYMRNSFAGTAWKNALEELGLIAVADVEIRTIDEQNQASGIVAALSNETLTINEDFVYADETLKELNNALTMRTIPISEQTRDEIKVETHPTEDQPFFMLTGPVGVESLNSYIIRVAHAANLSVKDFFRDRLMPIYTQLFRNDKQREPDKYFNLTMGWVITGSGNTARLLATSMEKVTNDYSIKHGTLLFLSSILHHRPILRKTRAWCSRCYTEWEEKQLTFYEPLTWAIAEVTLCRNHRSQLETLCPNPDCSRLQPFLTADTALGRCAYCNQWFGKNREELSIPNAAIDQQYLFEQWVADVVGELCDAIPTWKTEITFEIVRSGIESCISQLSSTSLQMFCRDAKITITSLDNIRFESNKVTLGILLRLCYALRITPLDLLAMKTITLDADLIQRYSVTKEAVDEQYRKAIDELLEDGPQPTRAEIASTLGISVDKLASILTPELSQKIDRRGKRMVTTHKHLNVIDFSASSTIYYLKRKGWTDRHIAESTRSTPNLISQVSHMRIDARAANRAMKSEFAIFDRQIITWLKNNYTPKEIIGFMAQDPNHPIVTTKLSLTSYIGTVRTRNDFALQSILPLMHPEAGEILSIDWIPMVPLGFDTTNKLKYVFIGRLLYSNYLYVCFLSNLKWKTFVESLKNCFQDLGGVPWVVCANRLKIGDFLGREFSGQPLWFKEYQELSTLYNFHPDIYELKKEDDQQQPENYLAQNVL